jgi:hypothetical protein
MISKQDMLDSIQHEFNICKHLHGKFTPESMEYRPSPAQRSTLELMRYLSVLGIAATRSMAAKDWSIYGSYKERAANMAAEDFPAAMDRQIEELREYLDSFSDEEFNALTLTLPNGQELPVLLGLMNSILKWFTAYKMQLFLYAKANGRLEMDTFNAWFGVDAPAKVPVAETAEEEA